MKRGHKIFIIITLVLLAVAFIVGRSNRYGAGMFDGDTIALLRVEGPIFDVRWHMDQVRDLMEDDGIKAVVLRIDSPGGAVAPTQELYTELLKLKEIKPVVTSMGTVAASGGYYLSCATDWIVSNPGTITGSVGVIMEFTNLEDLFSKLGVSSRTIKSGKFKDTGNPMRPMTDEEETLLQAMIMDTYDQFVEAVLEGRSVDEDKVRPYLDGRVLTGRQAHKLGLVDELGNINDAIEKATEMAGLTEVPEEIYEPERDRPGLFTILFGESAARALVSLSDSVRDQSSDRWLQLWRAF
ncbi:signal peptide peptidase SppA [bacterium]|nr:signal peptide peptidase SppA [bacterium]